MRPLCCKKGKEKIDLEELVTLDYTGSDGGYGYASCDFKSLEDWLSDNCSEEVALSLAVTLEDGIDFALDPEDGLSNGDEITVTILYDDDLLDGYDYQLVQKSGDKWKVTVDGLEEAKLNLKGAMEHVWGKSKYVVVYDLGGGSTEVSLASNAKSSLTG